jgi:hypothetical protein
MPTTRDLGSRSGTESRLGAEYGKMTTNRVLDVPILETATKERRKMSERQAQHSPWRNEPPSSWDSAAHSLHSRPFAGCRRCAEDQRQVVRGPERADSAASPGSRQLSDPQR